MTLRSPEIKIAGTLLMQFCLFLITFGVRHLGGWTKVTGEYVPVVSHSLPSIATCYLPILLAWLTQLIVRFSGAYWWSFPVFVAQAVLGAAISLEIEMWFYSK